jgi:hypothetical protein
VVVVVDGVVWKFGLSKFPSFLLEKGPEARDDLNCWDLVLILYDLALLIGAVL